jgi:hypothetical protein
MCYFGHNLDTSVAGAGAGIAEDLLVPNLLMWCVTSCCFPKTGLIAKKRQNP